MEPPIFMRHPDYADIELARVGIQCRTRPIIDHNGYLIPSRPCTVTVVIPTDDEAAELLYRRGNRVQLRGVIERMAVRQMANKLVRERLDDLQEDWASRREQPKGGEVFGDKERKELKREGANVMRKMDRFSRIARTAVLAIEVTPLPGATTIDRATAADDRTAYDLEQREAAKQRRAEQRERRARNKSHEQAARTAAAAAQDDHEAGAVDAPMGVTPIAEPLAHRRRKPVVAEVKDGADTSVPDAELGEPTADHSEGEAPDQIATDAVLVEA